MDKITYRRSLPVRIAKVGLGAAHRFLPKSMYNFFYGSLRRVLWVAQRVSLKVGLSAATVFNKKEAKNIMTIPWHNLKRKHVIILNKIINLNKEEFTKYLKTK